MTIQDWTTQTLWEGSSLKVMARVKDINNTNITQAAVSTISYRAVEDGTTERVASTALTVSSVVYDTLQTTSDDASWTLDSTGYNFMTILPPATFPNGGTTIYVPITFTDTSSRVSVLGIQVPVRESYVDTPA